MRKAIATLVIAATAVIAPNTASAQTAPISPTLRSLHNVVYQFPLDRRDRDIRASVRKVYKRG